MSNFASVNGDFLTFDRKKDRHFRVGLFVSRGTSLLSDYAAHSPHRHADGGEDAAHPMEGGKHRPLGAEKLHRKADGGISRHKQGKPLSVPSTIAAQ